MNDVLTHKLVLHNDNKNTFPYVMACLLSLCKHQPTQAEQCALITHLKGKCPIKHGNYMDLLELSTDLTNLDLKVSIEEDESSVY
jgi:ATP-dependent Clp protease adaptor protein ClpS